MNYNKDKILIMIAEIEKIVAAIEEQEQLYQSYLENVHPRFKESARNFIHYWVMRSFDMRSLQKKLGNLGLSRLAKSESHVMASLLSNISILKALIGEKAERRDKDYISIKESQKLLSDNARELFGPKTNGRKTRIMVTFPDETAEQLYLVRQMMVEGMNVIRINCAHNDEEVWKSMIANARRAMKTIGRSCKIAMDLSGPKIRTGSIAPGPKAVRLKPFKDLLGKVKAPVKVMLTAGACSAVSGGVQVPVSGEWLKQVEPGDKIAFKDARKKKRTLTVIEVSEECAMAYGYQSCYIETGTILQLIGKDADTEVGDLPGLDSYLLINNGERFIIHSGDNPGENAKYDKKGRLKSTAHISCAYPEIFRYVKPGEPIFFDDGQLEGIVREVRPDQIEVEAINVREGGFKLRSDRGLNLPDTSLKISGLTPKDKEDLQFIIEHADAVNMSFINSKKDVQDLIDEIKRLGAENKTGMILKIETKSGFHNLVEILLTAMQMYPVGVMIARGDLAIECGWENIGRIQDEILWLCQAAHIPTIWATQVLENLSKKGIPSRAEITDAVMSQRADCVMLNKGPYIVEAINMLHRILLNTQNYQNKKSPMLPAIEMKI